METSSAPHEADLVPLVAYLHLPPHASEHTQAVLEGHIRSFAEREGFRLHRLLAAGETPPGRARSVGQDGSAGVRELIGCVLRDGVTNVLVVGPARQALLALHRIRRVKVLTLAQVRPPGAISHRTGMTVPGMTGRATQGGADR